jgi:hypothetical protein
MKEEKMLKFSKFIFIITSLVLYFGCASTSSNNYKITLDPSLNSAPFIQGAWMQYTAHIRSDMDAFYKNNPDGNYIIPFATELKARSSMIDFYLRVKNDYKINDEYIESLILIRNSNLLNEYVYFSFNPGNWTKDLNLQEEQYEEWMTKNLPGHEPLTLAYVKLNN